MKKVFFKKQALILTLVAALGIAVYLNYYFSDRGVSVGQNNGSGNLGEAIFVNDSDDAETKDPSSVEVAGKVSYFEQARKNREEAREEAVDLIKDIAADLQADSSAAQKVMDQSAALVQAIERESNIESLVKAKGFEDCVVYIADKNCTVVVKAEALTPAQTLPISEIVTAQAGVPAENINILAVNS
ncbi:MAG: SpoIIIAH-like family protein [Clostridia bacterium]|nr:SpoIIIAH-like family protein [Clostridia bacterium]